MWVVYTITQLQLFRTEVQERVCERCHNRDQRIERPDPGSKALLLSIVIPTRNRAGILAQALTSLTRQTLPPAEFEVLVIDNGSTDGTKSTVDSLRREIENLHYFYEPTPGLHVGRHRGLAEARGEILVYADDDIEAVPSWLETVKDCFASQEVALVGGNNLPNYLNPSPCWLTRLWNRSSILGGHVISALSVMELPAGRYEIDPYLVWGCNFSVRKEILREAGGFHPDGMPQELIRFRGDGEDYIAQYILTNKYRCIFDSGASVYHAVTAERMTPAYFERRAFSQGISDSYTELRSARSAGAGYTLKRKLVRVAKRTASHLKRAIDSVIAHDEELIELARCAQKGYEEGYNYHQTIYNSAPEVRSWVHKDNYL